MAVGAVETSVTVVERTSVAVAEAVAVPVAVTVVVVVTVMVVVEGAAVARMQEQADDTLDET